MSIEFDCPNCSRRIRTVDEAAGKQARCPQCQQICSVPIPAPIQFPGDPFSPQSPQHFSGPYVAPYPNPNLPAPQNANLFDESHTPPRELVNPYLVPPPINALDLTPFTPSEVRQRLLGPAIGMTVGAAMCLGLIAFFVVNFSLNDHVAENVRREEDRNPVTGYIISTMFVAGTTIPSLLSLLGAWAMFRGRGLTYAWVGAMVALIPCNPCFFISAMFSIWAMIVLSDPRVHKAM